MVKIFDKKDIPFYKIIHRLNNPDPKSMAKLL